MDFEREVVLRGGETIGLRRQSYQVLRYLVQHRGRVVSKDELLDTVWRDAVVTEDSVTQCLVDIRKALGEEGRRAIKTVPRRGYIFEAEPLTTKSQPAGGSGARRSRAWLVGLALLLLALAIVIHWQATSDPVPQRHVVAVMPFEDFTSDGDRAYLAEGISEEILNRLARLPGLDVIARTSSFASRFRDHATAKEIARELGATLLIEGSVREEKGELRITVQLIDTESGFHLWSQHFDYWLDSTLRVEDHVAHTAADLLRLKYFPTSSAKRRLSPDDLELYLQSTHLLRTNHLDRLGEVRAQLETVLSRNPGHMETMRRLVEVYLTQIQVEAETQESAAGRVRELAALMAAEPDGEAYTSAALGELALRVDNDLATAAMHIDRAIMLNPGNDRFLLLGADLAVALGRFQQAVELYRAELRLDPFCSVCHLKLAHAYLSLGLLEAAEEAVEKFREMSRGGDFSLAQIRIMRGNYSGAQDVLDGPMPEAMHRYRDFYKLTLENERGDSDAFQAGLKSFIDVFGEQEPVRVSQLYALRGDLTSALLWLERARQQQLLVLLHSLHSPLFDNIRSEPEWRAFLRQIDRGPDELARIEFNAGGPGWRPISPN